MSYIITYSYSDGSGSGVVAAFAMKEDAERLLGLLCNHGDLSKTFKLLSAAPWGKPCKCGEAKPFPAFQK